MAYDEAHNDDKALLQMLLLSIDLEKPPTQCQQLYRRLENFEQRDRRI